MSGKEKSLYLEDRRQNTNAAEFLNTHDLSGRLSKIVRDADERSVIVSQHMQLTGREGDDLRAAAKREVDIKFVFGKEDVKKTEWETLRGVNGLVLYFLENLHAKCYFNECHMVIGSLSLYGYSRRNWEMGILLEAGGAEYESAVREAERILEEAERKPSYSKGSPAASVAESPSDLETIIREAAKPSSAKRNDRNSGFCIRCRTRVGYDTERPYCQNCYRFWKRWGNEKYGGEYCHDCGGSARIFVQRTHSYAEA